MDINSSVPSTLKETWNKVSSDKIIDKNDYAELLKAAAPTGKDTELDNEEMKFLSSIKDKMEPTGKFSLEKGSANTSISMFDDKDNNVPQSLKQEWSKVSSDGKITRDEYNKLVQTAAPTGKNEEFDQEEISFLADLKGKMEKGNGEFIIDPKTNDTSKIEKKNPDEFSSKIKNNINSIINSKDKSSSISSISKFSNDINKMDTKQLIKTAEIIKNLMAKTDGNDKPLGELQQLVFDKLKQE